MSISDNLIVKQYIDFVGSEEVVELVLRFNLNIRKFLGRWEQVLTSISTNLLGSGIFYSSVIANYSLLPDKQIKVVNTAYNGKFELTSIEGTSRARSALVPTCRTVKFGDQLIEGNYWIIYAAKDFNTIIVSAPIIIPLININLSDNFGLYVLTKDREQYWNSNEPHNVFNALKKYGFDRFYNYPVNSGKSFSIPPTLRTTSDESDEKDKKRKKEKKSSSRRKSDL